MAKASAPDLIPVAEVIPSTVEHIEDDDYILIKPHELEVVDSKPSNSIKKVQYKKNYSTITLFCICGSTERYINLLKMKAFQKNYVFMFKMENVDDVVIYDIKSIKKILKFSRN